MNDTIDPSTPAMDGPLFQAALDLHRSRFGEMPEALIRRQLRLDPTAAYNVVWGSTKKVEAFRAALVAQFGAPAGELLDRLPSVAMAARQADIDVKIAEDATDVAALHREMMKAYKRLVTDGDSLIQRGHLPEDALDQARDIQGYQASLDSTLVAVRVLRQSWSRLSGHTPLTAADIDGAEAAAARMSQAISNRDHGVTTRPAAELRTRALSALFYDYDELRRMMAFLRWREGDAESLAPSLFAGRGRKASDDDATEAPTPETPGPALPVNGGPAFPQ